MKQVIFNVGGALSVYTEFDNKKLLIDIGKSSFFDPVLDFLKPLFDTRNDRKSNFDNSRYHIDQLLISHPHNDHISSLENFKKYFYAELLTSPNDNAGMSENHKINWQLVGENDNVNILKEMLTGRFPPLRTTSDQNEFIYYIPPKDCENSAELSSESYCNNISIAVFLILNRYRIFLPGDLQKLGMEELLKKNYALRKNLSGGVDVLITPHHGLRSSFSASLFNEMKGKKTRSINIVSEKSDTKDDRKVDTRYSTADYCLGKNNLGSSTEKHYQVKTSHGHIFIDYNHVDHPKIDIIDEHNELINRFI